LLSSSIRWTNAGMAYRGAFSIASTSESPSVAAECSLSDILVAHAHPKYSLSPKAAVGILRRAERRGKALPPALEMALRTLSEQRDRDGEATLTMIPTSPNGQAPSILADTGEQEHTVARGKAVPHKEHRKGSLPPIETQDITDSKSQTPMGNQGRLQSANQAVMEPTTALMSVRRLTPTECERLQSLPDGWTHVHGAPMVGATPLWETLSRLWWPDGSGDGS